jgi:hypothetical protein
MTELPEQATNDNWIRIDAACQKIGFHLLVTRCGKHRQNVHRH